MALKRIPVAEDEESSLYRMLTWRKHTGRRLNLGCGLRHLQHVTNIDRLPDVEPDVVCDFDREPLPFEDDSVDYVCSVNVFEHLVNLYHVVGEIWRVCKPGALFELVVPNAFALGAFGDPTHCRFWTIESHVYLNANTYTFNTAWYTSDRFHFTCPQPPTLIPEPGSRKVWELVGQLPRPLPEVFKHVLGNHGVGIFRYLFFRFVVTKPLPLDMEATIKVYPEIP
jgi:SAM-dependent methyltransferase